MCSFRVITGLLQSQVHYYNPRYTLRVSSDELCFPVPDSYLSIYLSIYASLSSPLSLSLPISTYKGFCFGLLE